MTASMYKLGNQTVLSKASDLWTKDICKVITFSKNIILKFLFHDIEMLISGEQRLTKF